MAEVIAMNRLHKFFAVTSFAAALAAPAVAHAQTTGHGATQLFLAPTGRALPKGQGYFKAVGLGIPSWQGGITDRFSVGLMVPVFALGQAAVFTPKFQIQRSENHSTSIGTISVVTTFGSGSVAYVAHTIERKTGAVHVTVMEPIGFLADPRATVVMLGAERRINSRVTFMTENYVFTYGRPIISGGIRLRTARLTWDFGVLVPPTFDYGARPAPMISGGWKF
jgi:hypothetical protein